MSQSWIRQKADELKALGYTDWAAKIKQASDSGNIQGLVVNAPIDKASGRALPPTFELRDWSRIGKDKFVEP